jgi:hypothetical protein
MPKSSESFDNVYLDLSKENGKCRFAENGLGWKPAGGGDAFTLDQSNIGGAQWSRAAKGYEVKIMQRNSGIIQLDGFQQEVMLSGRWNRRPVLTLQPGLRATEQDLQELVQHKSREQGALAARLELGQSRVRQGRAYLQRPEPTGIRGSILRDLQHQPSGPKRDRRRILPQ